MARDLYQVLGVQPDASKDEIASAYKKAVMKVHPDRNPGDPEAVNKLVELNSAYSVLSDDSKKDAYDKSRRGPQVNVHFGGFDFNVGAWGESPFHRATAPGKDVEVELRISLKEAVLGTTKSVRAKTGHEVMCNVCAGSRCAPGSGRAPCTHCAGTGKAFYPGQGNRIADCRHCAGHGDVPFRVCRECLGKGNVRAEKEFNIRIPSGITEEHRLRAAGQGEMGIGGRPGDMFVNVKIEDDPKFSRKGNDLHTTVRVPFHVAAGERPIKVVGIDGVEHTIELASRMRPGETTVAIQNAGVPSMTGARGRLLVLLQADLPAPRTPRGNILLRELINELSERRNSVPSPDDDYGKREGEVHESGDY